MAKKLARLGLDRRFIRVQRHQHVRHQRGSRALLRLGTCSQGRQRLVEQIRNGTHPGKSAVGDFARKEEGFRAQCRDQQRDWCSARCGSNIEKCAVMIDFALTQKATQHRDVFSQIRQRGSLRQAIDAFDDRAVAGADPQAQAAWRDIVNGERLLRHDEWMAWIGGYNGRPQANLRRSRCRYRRYRQVIGSPRAALGQPDLAQAGALGLDDPVDRISGIFGDDG